MNVGIAYPAFLSSFKTYFPNIGVVDLKKNYDLIIFSGGEDINPAIYGEEPTYTTYWSKERDGIELLCLEKALRENIKILGTCRGHQLINAVLGGKLIQDIYKELGYIHGGTHDLEIIEDTSLTDIFKNGVNSLHHQGVTKIGDGLNITSKFKGVIESTENDQILSVQWHPEWMDNSKFFDYVKEWIQK